MDSLEGETIELGDDLKSCSKGNFILLMNYIKPRERPGVGGGGWGHGQRLILKTENLFTHLCFILGENGRFQQSLFSCYDLGTKKKS